MTDKEAIEIAKALDKCRTMNEIFNYLRTSDNPVLSNIETKFDEQLSPDMKQRVTDKIIMIINNLSEKP